MVSDMAGMTSEEKPIKTGLNGVKIFSATMYKDRTVLGERLTEWIEEHPEYEIIDTIVTQSSDKAFHCLTFTVFYKETTD